MSDMLAQAANDTSIGIVLFPKNRSLADDVWNMKEYLRSFADGCTTVAVVRARFPLLTDEQWTTMRQQSEFVLNRRSTNVAHTFGLKAMMPRRDHKRRRTTRRPTTPPRKHRRTDDEEAMGTIRRLLRARSSPVGTHDIIKETALPREIVSRCLEKLIAGQNPSVYEFVDGSIRTYGSIQQ